MKILLKYSIWFKILHVLATGWIFGARQEKNDPEFWSLQPIVRPDAVGIDELVIKGLDAKGLKPSKEADRRTLIRRLTFDLLGLPPTPEEIENFLNDKRQDAYERLVDRLLASPHFGERWARHWMDVVSFGESHGFEYNQPRNNSWHYRNWLIEAFNDDMPYDQFAQLQIAGDAIPEAGPEGIMATGFLVAGPHNTTMPQSDPMRKTMRQDEMEGMIAVVGQTFLGLTLNCARCHDHKTDPITQKDYYRVVASLSDVAHGERNVSLASPDVRQEIDQLKVKGRVIRNRLRNFDSKIREAILAEREKNPDKIPQPPKSYESWDFRHSLDGEAGKLQVVLKGGAKQNDTGLHFDGKNAYAATEPITSDFMEKTLEVWVKLANLKQGGGGAMSLQTIGGGQFDAIVFGEREPRKWMAGSDRFLRYQPFKGKPESEADEGPIHLAITYAKGGTITGYREGQPYGESYASKGPVVYQRGKAQVVFGLRHSPPGGNRMLAGTVVRAKLFDRTLTPAEVAASAGMSSDFVSEEELVDALNESQRKERSQLKAEAEGLQKRLSILESENRPIPVYALNSRKPPVVHVLNRGNVLEPAAEAKPGGIGVIAGAEFGLDSNASGLERRKKLAAWITDPESPLFSRVIVNRLWHHYFGAGIVNTPNDFGYSGGRPSHSELLDWLADELKRKDWSLKAMHKMIVLSKTYRQASTFNESAAGVDADNRLLWRKSPRRLEGEEIRDAMLAISGKLDMTVGGRGYRDVREYKFKGSHFYDLVPQDQPEHFRRTVYRFSPRGARRTMLDTLDCPDPSAITPKRAVTTTPLQSLALMNNDLVLALADTFAERIKSEANPVHRAYELTFGRPPSEEEQKVGEAFIQKHGLVAYCRVLFNSNEFLHVR